MLPKFTTARFFPTMLKCIGLTVIGRFLGLASVLLIVAACDRATLSDRDALRAVQQQWGNKYDFKLSSEIYWTARAKPNVAVEEEDLRAALSVFAARIGRRSSAFVYLNVYDSTGRFVFQLYQGNNGEIVKETKPEHY